MYKPLFIYTETGGNKSRCLIKVEAVESLKISLIRLNLGFFHIATFYISAIITHHHIHLSVSVHYHFMTAAGALHAQFLLNKNFFINL